MQIWSIAKINVFKEVMLTSFLKRELQGNIRSLAQVALFFQKAFQHAVEEGIGGVKGGIEKVLKALIDLLREDGGDHRILSRLKSV